MAVTMAFPLSGLTGVQVRSNPRTQEKCPMVTVELKSKGRVTGLYQAIVLLETGALPLMKPQNPRLYA
jgi:hypothetical protein